jgi:hypothetical protein
MVVDEADIADRAAANLRGQLGDFVVGDFGGGIENVKRAQSSQPLRLVGRFRERRSGSLRGRLSDEDLIVTGTKSPFFTAGGIETDIILSPPTLFDHRQHCVKLGQTI